MNSSSFASPKIDLISPTILAKPLYVLGLLQFHHIIRHTRKWSHNKFYQSLLYQMSDHRCDSWYNVWKADPCTELRHVCVTHT